MSEDKQLVPVEQKEIEFYGDELTAVRASDDQIYVSIRHMCDALGLSVQPQARRVQRHNILADGFIVAKMATIKGDRPANWLRVDLVPLWLSGLSTNAVNEEIRPKLERFQREAAKVLWEAFQEGRLTGDTEFAELLKTDTDAVQAYKVLQALVKLARNQVVLESRIDSHERHLVAHDMRLEEVEDALGLRGEEPTVTEAQASQISQAVKAVAVVLGKQSGRNEFGGVYGEMYRKFSVTGYKLLPAAKFQEAMNWLTEWHQNIVGRTDE